MNDFTKEQMLAAYRQLPEPIRDAFSDSQVDDVIAGLQKTYQLHIDVVGTINKETNYLLLGLINPAQYAERLRKNAQIPESTLAAIIKEINEKIFAPLREKMRAPAINPSAPAETPTNTVAPKVESTPAAASIPVVPIVKPTIPLNMPTMSTPMQDKVLNRLAPAGTMPVPAPAPTPMPKVSAPAPTNLPGVIVPKPVLPQVIAPVPVAPPPAPAPKVMPTAMPAMQAAPKPPQPAASSTQPPVKSYAVDPYREQPEEHEK